MKAAVIYWSGTGNTEQMAQAIADAAGAELFAVSDFSGSIADYDRIAFGCSAMGDEVLEEDEFEPFFASIEGDLSGKTIYGNVVDARTKLSTVHVPTEGRWLLVSPEIYGLLLKSPEFIKASDLGDAVVQTGAVGRIAGFTVFEDSTLGENVEYIAGHPNWFAFIDEWAVPVHVQDLNGSSKYIGASAVKGRKVYAFKVTKPQTILIKKKA